MVHDSQVTSTMRYKYLKFLKYKIINNFYHFIHTTIYLVFPKLL